MFKKLLMIAWVGLVGLSLSCEGPQGEVGPAGPAGAAGPAGPAGPAGQDGADGASDSSSGASGSIIAFMGEIETDTSGNVVVGDDAFFEGFSEDEIASVEKGAFQVYIKDDGAYFPLPGFVLFADEAISYGFYYVVDELGLYFPIYRTSAADTPQRTFEEIRVLLIPAINARANANVNWKNYEEAVAALGLAEKDVKKVSRKMVPSNLLSKLKK